MVETISYLDSEGLLSGDAPAIDPSLLVRGYKTMVQTRLVDDKMITLQRQGAISFAMSSLGEEACAVASAAALLPQDWMYPQYREAGIMFWRGFTIGQYVDHMFGNADDLILGRQMPNHFGARALNVVTVSSPIATKIPHAAGCAYAMKLQGEEAVAISYFGDGATSEGDFHCGVNFAAVLRAPALFFCRNNGYAISTPVDRQFASDGIAPKGIGYGIESLRVDGNDFFAVYSATLSARKRCLAGGGPVLIEAMTYRLGAHSTSDDPSRYRDELEVARWRQRCPVKRLRHYLTGQGLWDDRQEEALQQALHEEIEQAVAAAQQKGPPPLRSLFENVYLHPTPALERQRELLERYLASHPPTEAGHG